MSGLENNYFHWLVECYGKLRSHEVLSAKPDFYVVATERPFQREYLDLLGISKDRIIPSQSRSLIRAEELMVPTYLNADEFVANQGLQSLKKHYIPEWILGLSARRRVRRSAMRSGRRIYISRRKAAYRKLQNEPEISGCLLKHGFSTHVLEEMSVKAQMKLFAEADHVVGLHGAGLANMLFCPPGAKILELYPRNYNDPSFRILAAALGLSHNYLVCDPVLRRHASVPVPTFRIYGNDVRIPWRQREDALIDAGAFSDAMEIFCGQAPRD